MDPTVLLAPPSKDTKSVEPEGVDNGSAVGSHSTPDSCRETLRINHEEQALQHHITLGIQEKLRKI